MCIRQEIVIGLHSTQFSTDISLTITQNSSTASWNPERIFNYLQNFQPIHHIAN